MTKWVNPTSRRRLYPAWDSILVAIGIVGLLVLTCPGCSLHAHFHLGGQSNEPPITITIPETGNGTLESD